MLSRLNVTRLALATVSVFALGLVHPTSASAKSPVSGQGTGPMPPPSAPASASGSDSVAYAVPRNAPSPDVEIVLPDPLPPSAVAMYDRILILQKNNDFSEADRLIRRLGDTTLVGSILADRYLSANYITTPSELLDWFANLWRPAGSAGDLSAHAPENPRQQIAGTARDFAAAGNDDGAKRCCAAGLRPG